MSDVMGSMDADDATETTNVVHSDSDVPVEHREPTWWIADGKPGDGDRPDWLPEKFKSVEDLSKSYHELEKQFTKMPEDYDLTKAKWIDPDYEPFKEFTDLARKNRVPNEVMDKMLDSVGKYLDEFSINYEEEKSLLGDNAKERLALINNWAKSNLSEDSYFALTSNLKTADSIKALEELRAKMLGNNTMIPGNNDPVTETASVEDIEQEMADNLDKYQKDARYRKEITQKIERALSKQSM